MPLKFILPMARNTITGETVKTQDLNGVHFTESQKILAQGIADKLAAGLTARTGVEWRGFLKNYKPGENLPK
jgi:hypothetical protein